MGWNGERLAAPVLDERVAVCIPCTKDRHARAACVPGVAVGFAGCTRRAYEGKVRSFFLLVQGSRGRYRQDSLAGFDIVATRLISLLAPTHVDFMTSVALRVLLSIFVDRFL